MKLWGNLTKILKSITLIEAIVLIFGVIFISVVASAIVSVYF